MLSQIHWWFLFRLFLPKAVEDAFVPVIKFKFDGIEVSDRELCVNYCFYTLVIVTKIFCQDILNYFKAFWSIIFQALFLVTAVVMSTLILVWILCWFRLICYLLDWPYHPFQTTWIYGETPSWKIWIFDVSAALMVNFNSAFTSQCSLLTAQLMSAYSCESIW